MFARPAIETPEQPVVGKQRKPAPVESATVTRGLIENKRTFSGTLEARSEFVIAPKVAGRVERLTVNIADPVKRGQLVGELDSAEYVQAVAQAKAELAVTQANLVEAENALKTAERELSRFETLKERGVASAAQFDSVQADAQAKRSEVEVAKAQVLRSTAALESARIRLGYTQIKADWSDGEDQRVVAERYINEGETVSANTPLLRIVELDPISGVVFVSERDYGRLQPGQDVTLTTDAFPGQVFPGKIKRIAPIFREETRQARVELSIENEDQRLKPGMFIRVIVVLERVPDAVIVPERAITKRNDRTGVFLVDEEGSHVSWREVMVGIRSGGQVQLLQELSGRVVTLGQQLLEDGSAITIPELSATDASRKGAHESQ